MKVRYPLVDLFKWVALATMLGSHTVKIYAPEFWASHLFWLTNALGFPLFALAFAYTTKVGYQRPFNLDLFTWACLSQVPFTLIFGFRLNILFAFQWALLPFPFSILAALTIGQITDGGILGVLLLVMARQATLPLPPQLPFPVPRAKAYPAIYAFHLWLLTSLILIYGT